MTELPEGFRSVFVACGGTRLHAVTNAPQGADAPVEDLRPAIVFLHGFPEYWAGWRDVFSRLCDDYLVIAPDQRGYNLSDAPQGVEHYATGKLVGDLLALTSSLIGERQFILAGHDWGASVAYAAAIGAPDRVSGLVIANGVHPVVFQRALLSDPEQAAASQYIHRLCMPGAAERMAQDDFALTLGMLEKFSATDWLNEATRQGYREAWSRPGRLDAMLNWYRASPLVVPGPDGAPAEAPLTQAPAEKFVVAMPHLLIWGDADQALRPAATEGLEAFAPQLERMVIPGADHWLIHSHAGQIADAIDRFARALPGG
ncbi:MAG: alpha/beta fold hydrolase [Pseudomonadota bacterium]|nr:alpha/beta fold hydrolase [Pseudomonadota bacterium]